jgi:hypothetical protein
MNLYRLIVINSPDNLERGVWAEEMTQVNNCYFFRNPSKDDKLVAAYPCRITIITSIEPREEYEAAQKRKEEALKEITAEKVGYTRKKW